MSSFLTEGLQPLDLEHLVLDQIEIDTFVPKLDDTNVVLAFFVKEEDPAYDLSRFIEFGPVDILDTEVSPAPDEDGHYLVFVEIEKKDMAKNILSILKVVKYLSGVDKWKYHYKAKSSIVKV